MTRLKNLLHPVKKEFQRDNCGFDHAPADDFVKSQWQNCTKSNAYLIYRWIIAFIFIGIVIESMIDPDDKKNFWLYFIYLTNWGIWLCMLTNLLGAILVTIWHYHPEYADKLLNLESITSPFRIYWAMHITTLVVSVMISIVYWSLLYNAAQDGLSATNIMTHAFNSIFMFIDLLIVAHPLRLLHVFLPVLFGIIYAIFSFIYQSAGGVNKKGKHYIYHVIDWNRPEMAIVTIVSLTLLTCCIYLILFTIYKLRVRLYRRVNNSSFFLPTTTTNGNTKKSSQQKKDKDKNNPAAPGIQHSPSGISMVLGNYAGCHNQGFVGSKENIIKV